MVRASDREGRRRIDRVGFPQCGEGIFSCRKQTLTEQTNGVRTVPCV